MGERNELMWNLLSFVFVQGESLNKITNTEKNNEITERECSYAMLSFVL
jgi:hypothetical protein